MSCATEHGIKFVFHSLRIDCCIRYTAASNWIYVLICIYTAIGLTYYQHCSRAPVTWPSGLPGSPSSLPVWDRCRRVQKSIHHQTDGPPRTTGWARLKLLHNLTLTHRRRERFWVRATDHVIELLTREIMRHIETQNAKRRPQNAHQVSPDSFSQNNQSIRLLQL